MDETFAAFQQREEWLALGKPAQDQYSYEVDYHNWDHALDIAERSFGIAVEIKERGIHLPAGRLAVAAAWHDAGHHEDHRSLGFATKEQYSVQLMRDFMRGHEQTIKTFVAPDESTQKYVLDIQKAIEGTMHRARRNSYYGLVLHRADIQNIGGPQPEFIANAWKLFQESRRSKPELEYVMWQSDTLRFIEKIIAESPRELYRLNGSREEVETFNTSAVNNAVRLGRLSESEHYEMSKAA